MIKEKYERAKLDLTRFAGDPKIVLDVSKPYSKGDNKMAVIPSSKPTPWLKGARSSWS